jgi:hypothetical protein
MEGIKVYSRLRQISMLSFKGLYLLHSVTDMSHFTASSILSIIQVILIIGKDSANIHIGDPAFGVVH